MWKWYFTIHLRRCHFCFLSWRKSTASCSVYKSIRLSMLLRTFQNCFYYFSTTLRFLCLFYYWQQTVFVNFFLAMAIGVVKGEASTILFLSKQGSTTTRKKRFVLFGWSQIHCALDCIKSRQRHISAFQPKFLTNCLPHSAAIAAKAALAARTHNKHIMQANTLRIEII